MDVVKTGALIAQARKEKELTQKALAEQLHVSVQAVSKWERGAELPRHRSAGAPGRGVGPHRHRAALRPAGGGTENGAEPDASQRGVVGGGAALDTDAV